MPPTPTTSAQALSNYNSFAQGMQSPDAIYQQQSSQLGVPQQQQQVSGLRQAVTNTTNLLNNVAPSVMGRTADSLVTSAQANRQIQNESAPIAANLKTQEGNLTNANADLSTLLSEAQNRTNADIAGQSNQLGALKSIYDALFGQEQASQAAALDAQKMAEQQREFNATNALDYAKINAATAPGPTLSSLLGGVGGGSSSLPGISFKNTSLGGKGGFGFTLGSSPISAASWAAGNGVSIADLLYSMANQGDSTAAQAYQTISKNGGNITPQIKSQFSSLFWGT